MKVDSDVLLLSYLDKICLTLTGELRRALACLYSEGEAILVCRASVHSFFIDCQSLRELQIRSVLIIAAIQKEDGQ